MRSWSSHAGPPTTDLLGADVCGTAHCRVERSTIHPDILDITNTLPNTPPAPRNTPADSPFDSDADSDGPYDSRQYIPAIHIPQAPNSAPPAPSQSRITGNDIGGGRDDVSDDITSRSPLAGAQTARGFDRPRFRGLGPALIPDTTQVTCHLLLSLTFLT